MRIGLNCLITNEPQNVHIKFINYMVNPACAKRVFPIIYTGGRKWEREKFGRKEGYTSG